VARDDEHPRAAGSAIHSGDAAGAARSVALDLRRNPRKRHPRSPSVRFVSASVEHFLTAAARDPNVLAIKMTLYRTSGDTEIVRALTEAAQRGKQVAVMIELQARFDEVNKHRVGAHAGGFRCARCVRASRSEDPHENRACHPEGSRRHPPLRAHRLRNYNSQTARVYTDLGLFTADPSIGADLTDLFNSLTGFSRQNAFRNLLVAPRNMRQRFTEMVDREAEHARAEDPVESSRK